MSIWSTVLAGIMYATCGRMTRFVVSSRLMVLAFVPTRCSAFPSCMWDKQTAKLKRRKLILKRVWERRIFTMEWQVLHACWATRTRLETGVVTIFARSKYWSARMWFSGGDKQTVMWLHPLHVSACIVNENGTQHKLSDFNYVWAPAASDLEAVFLCCMPLHSWCF